MLVITNFYAKFPNFGVGINKDETIQKNKKVKPKKMNLQQDLQLGHDRRHTLVHYYHY